MKLATTLFLALAFAVPGSQTWAATTAEPDAHHLTGAVSEPAVPAMPSKSKYAMARIDAQMKSMQEIHNKMMAAKTPEERAALTVEHTKAMQEGMAMMKGTTPGDISGMRKDIALRQQIMEKHMELMQYMLQMMMDRLPPESSK
jgi:hypothetical protein